MGIGTAVLNTGIDTLTSSFVRDGGRVLTRPFGWLSGKVLRLRCALLRSAFIGPGQGLMSRLRSHVPARDSRRGAGACRTLAGGYRVLNCVEKWRMEVSPWAIMCPIPGATNEGPFDLAEVVPDTASVIEPESPPEPAGPASSKVLLRATLPRGPPDRDSPASAHRPPGRGRAGTGDALAVVSERQSAATRYSATLQKKRDRREADSLDHRTTAGESGRAMPIVPRRSGNAAKTSTSQG